MDRNTVQATRISYIQRSWLIGLLLLLLLIPVVLSNNPAGTFLGSLVLVVALFFPGYLLSTLLNQASIVIRVALSAVFGLVTATTAYDVFALASLVTYFPYFVVVLSAAGMILFARQVRHTPSPLLWTAEVCETVVAGSVVALAVAPLFWRSGRFSGREFVFHGPAGQDQLFHVTMLQRLLHHIPPDNFMFAGLRATVYHYFDDLTLALILRVQSTLHLGVTDLFDLYYRCYPTLVYFLIGALAYLVGRQLLGTAKGGILSVLLLLGAGGLGWFFGILQMAVHAAHFTAVRELLFSTWTAWDGVDVIRPLVHRPAHYHGLLISLAAINILLRPERARRHWILAGLMLGLMAGFNFTLAATFGVAAVLGVLLCLLKRRQEEARNLAGLALFIFVGSLPVNAVMLWSGFHNMAPGFPFRGPNLEFPTAIWGTLLGRMLPRSIVPWAALIMLPIIAYGVKLFGIGALKRLDLGEDRHRGLAMLFAITFVISFVIGTFFPYQGLEVGIIFLQPTIWILALFAVCPINAWLERNRRNWRAAVLWGVLALTWVQSLAAFNFSCEAVFSQETAHVLQDLRLTAAPDDVVAYLPSGLTSRPIWGHTEISTNFSIMAMTGLDGYFSSEDYSKFSAVPGLSGSNSGEVLSKAEHLYHQRRDDVESYIQGNLTPAVAERLANDHVRWIVISGDALPNVSSATPPWRRTRDVIVYRLAP